MGPKPLSARHARPDGLHGKARPALPAQAGLAQALDSGIDAAAALERSLAGDGEHSLSADVALDDWPDLLDAVKARLRQTVAGHAPQPSMGAAAFLHIQAGVLDCAAALDQLQATLAHELGRCRQRDQDLRTTQAALAQARAELAGTRAEALRVRHLALHDSLTGLPNRSFFRERLQWALSQAGPAPPWALLRVNLDGFKAINDTHGHATGDALLRIVAARLARVVRAEDMMSRLGSDEFGCLPCGWPEQEQLVRLARRLFNAVSAPLTCDPLQLCVQPSIGIALYPGDGESADDLLAHADAAMLRARQQGGGHAFFAASEQV